MRTQILLLVSCVVVAVVAGSIGIEPVQADHALAKKKAKKKPREIVVVGSKVKDVVRSAGFDITDAAIRALDREVQRWLREAGQRARRNCRKTPRAFDLDCLPRVSHRDLIVRAGLRSDGELVQAVSDKVYAALEDAVHRAGANKRGTVRPYDL